MTESESQSDDDLRLKLLKTEIMEKVKDENRELLEKVGEENKEISKKIGNIETEIKGLKTERYFLWGLGVLIFGALVGNLIRFII